MQVAIRELRNHTKDVLDAVERGEEVILTRMGEPVALISPINQASTVADWLDDIETEPTTDTGWLNELIQARRGQRSKTTATPGAWWWVASQRATSGTSRDASVGDKLFRADGQRRLCRCCERLPLQR